MALTKINLASGVTGTLPTGNYSAKIGQVVQTGSDYSVVSTSTSYVDFESSSGTVWETAITPTATSSKIFVFASIGGYKKDGGAIYLSIFRGSTNLGDANRGMINGDANNVMYSSAMTVLDSPSTTSSTTYEVRMRSAGGDTVRLNADYVESNIVVMEVSA